MRLTLAAMAKRHATRAKQIKRLQTRICHLEIANRDLRDSNAKLRMQNRQLKCPE